MFAWSRFRISAQLDSMSDKHPIVISDSESDTLSESDRPCHTHASRANAAECNNQSHHAHKHATPSNALIASQDSSQTQPSCADATSSVASTSAAGFLSLLPDRRQLELDRMQRASKRKRQLNLPCSSSDDETQSDTKQCKLNNASVASTASTASTASQPLAVLRPSANPRTSTCVGEPSSSSKPQNSSYSMAADAITASSRFWHGSVKHGYNRYAAPSVSGVSISQMLLPATPSSRSSLELAVLATYDLRIDWLYSLFPRQLPVTLVLPPPKEDYRVNEHVARPGLHPSHIFGGDFTRCPGWQICVPNKPKGGWLTQHIKFLILVHQRFLRVAILSGNLNAIDWDRIENTAYIQDFPLLGQASMINHGSGSSSGSKSSQNDFKSQLVRVLRSLSMPASHAVYAALDRYDFSLATRARIVASWPEAASLREWDQIETQGLGRLGKVVRDLGIKESVELECQGSSLANHDVKWIEHFHLLASGVEPRGLLPLKGKPNEVHPEYASAIGATSKGNALPPVKIVFPSHRYVHETTVEGAMGALSFFGKAEAWSNSP